MPMENKNIKTGIKYYYHRDDSIKMSVSYLNSQRHGVTKHWHRNGQLSHEYSYHKGQLHGTERMWDRTGQLEYEHAWHQGQEHGIEKGWENGRLSYKFYHLYGDTITEEEYRRHELISKLSGL